MLKELRIRHLILVEKMEIHFHEAFNVVSGETGAGKSAMMSALNLVLGERADGALIRHGEEKGSAEALFTLDGNEAVTLLLEEAGIDIEEGEVVLRREIRQGGKTRAFINSCIVPLHLLKTVGKLLVKFVDQHAAQELLALEHHRHLLDSYAGADKLLNTFKEKWKKQKQMEGELVQLRAGETRRQREIEILRQELEEIDLAAIAEEEEETLFAEYTKLTHAEELQQKKEATLNLLEGEGKSVASQLRLALRTLDEVVAIDAELAELRTLLQQATVEIKEVAYALNVSGGEGEMNPYRLAEIDERLAVINKIKKRYGPGVADVLAYREEVRCKLERLEGADHHIEELEKMLNCIVQEADQLAVQLTEQRRLHAVPMAEKIEHHLHRLNMPKARFSINIRPQERNSFGDDLIEFFLAPNVGEEAVSVRHAASGGEISRLMLSLQALLAGKEKVPTLLFDEIDANVGGKTAGYVGEKLCAIAAQHQVICITHFPQVAQKAAHHLQISKEEIDGRTLTLISALKGKARDKELARMRGE